MLAVWREMYHGWRGMTMSDKVQFVPGDKLTCHKLKLVERWFLTARSASAAESGGTSEWNELFAGAFCRRFDEVGELIGV